MFGLLSMIKRTADTFNLATFEQLADVKYTFMHAHGMLNLLQTI